MTDFIGEYAPLVKRCSRPYARRHPQWREDIEQEGMVGLLVAADRFNPSRGLKFSTFAYRHILGHIQHFVRDIVPIVKGARGGIRPKVVLLDTGASVGHACYRDAFGTADPTVAAAEDRAHIGRAVGKLTGLQRKTILAIMSGDRYADIAVIMVPAGGRSA